MVVGLKQSIPYVIQAIPEVSFTGKWLSERMAENIHNLIQAGFCVRGIVTDNHSANINAFSSLVKTFNSESNLYIEHAQNHGKKTYLFYDSVHLVKNIHNNLLNGKSLFFQSLSTMMICISAFTGQQVIFLGVIYTTFMTEIKN